MSHNTLFDKVWGKHKVRSLPTGQDQILIGLHLIHEVTSPQAFGMLDERGLRVRFPHRTFATADHIIPTKGRGRPLLDPMAERMLSRLEENCAKHGITFFNLGSAEQGIVHIIGPELGLTLPGSTIACGDSHTSTHGAFGAIALGIGTTQISSVLATGCVLLVKPKVRQIRVTGSLSEGVTAKDVILKILNHCTIEGGIGYAYEYAGSVIENFSMEERMTVCNMSIEGGTQYGYVNPDQKTVEYLIGRRYAPKGPAFLRNEAYWKSIRTEKDAQFDDYVTIAGREIEPMITWGITPGESIPISGKIPRTAAQESLDYMGFMAGEEVLGEKVDVAFIGSCTNGRISDLREAAGLIKAKGLRVADHVKALVVPGSEQVRKQAEAEGLHQVFIESGWDWREAGCSMCLAMNPDKLVGPELCASSSNRNFKGRQGSKTGRTLLMSPISVVACATQGKVTDVRELLN